MSSASFKISLETLLVELGNLESRKELNADGLHVPVLPDSIGRLSNLVALRLRELPMELGNLESLIELIAEDLTVPILPDSLGCLIELVELKLSYNSSLETLLEDLKWDCIVGCSGLGDASKAELEKLFSETSFEVLVLSGVAAAGECKLMLPSRETSADTETGDVKAAGKMCGCT